MLKATCYYSRTFNDIAATQCPDPVRMRDGKLVCLIHWGWMRWSADFAKSGRQRVK